MSPAAAPAPAPVFSLADCVNLALARQPGLAAQRASLAAAADNSRAVDNLRVPTLLARDLPIRRRQACLGVTVAAAGLNQAERDTIYAVTRNYYSVIYARAQVELATKAVEQLEGTRLIAQGLANQGARNVTKDDSRKVTVYLKLAESRKVQAEEGVERAMAALKEAIGLGPDCCFMVAADALAVPPLTVCRHDIVALALGRRGELVQASVGAAVAGLEVDAQGTSCRPKMATFAAVADIHSRQVPPEISDGDYRPGGIPPEMPGTLVGSRAARQERARALNARAHAVVDKTRNLIVLEAEDAYLKWEDAHRRVPPTQEGAETARTLAADLAQSYRTQGAVKVEELLTFQVLAVLSKSESNQALYQELLALAAMERVTAGGFCAGLGAAVPGSPDEAHSNNGSPREGGTVPPSLPGN
jgi:outer membrane protein TolC